MFTGLVEETAPVVDLQPVAGGAVLSVRASLVAEDARPGDSIAVNGCCLTVTRIEEDGRLSFDRWPKRWPAPTWERFAPAPK